MTVPADLLDQGREVPLHVQIACAKRELSMRRNVYPRRIASGVMTKALADRETAAMAAIVATLEALLEAEGKK